MNAIGSVKLTYQEIEDLRDLLDTFKPDTNGKKVVKIQEMNGKLDIKYEDGE